MLHLRRLPAILLPAALVLGLSACGTESTQQDDSLERLAAVEISGEIGEEPEVEWKGRMIAGDIESETLVTGEGEVLGAKDQVLAHLWIGNGFVKDKALSTFDEDSSAELLTVDDTLPPFLAAIDGATVGSRIAVTSSAEDAFGEAGNSQLGIGNKDSILVVIDLVSTIADGPSGERFPPPPWMPPMEFEKGDPARFDFAGVPTPTDRLRKAVLLEGEGAVVEEGDTIVVQYLGQTFGGEAPFDETFTTTPLRTKIGVGDVIEGWDRAIVGSTVGSRMVLSVPPDLGYGEEGNKDAGIKGDDTLIFVLDILAAA